MGVKSRKNDTIAAIALLLIVAVAMFWIFWPRDTTAGQAGQVTIRPVDTDEAVVIIYSVDCGANVPIYRPPAYLYTNADTGDIAVVRMSDDELRILCPGRAVGDAGGY